MKGYGNETINNLSGEINNCRIGTRSDVLYGPDEGQHQTGLGRENLEGTGALEYFIGLFGWGLRGSSFVV